MLTLTLEMSIPTAVARSPNVLRVAAMFGLGVDDRRDCAVVPRTELSLAPHEVVFITGPSGSGKSTLIRLIREGIVGRDDVRVIDLADLPPLRDAALVDALSGADAHTLERTLRLLALAGLNDAFVMLRSPSQLSDGQRCRLRLAQAMAGVEDPGSEPDAASPAAPQRWTVVLADEFGATLDRATAKVIAANVRKWTRRAPVCFIAATTHDDLLEPLDPDCVIEQRLGAGLEMARRSSGSAVVA